MITISRMSSAIEIPEAVADFKSHGLNVEFASFPGAHEWQVWRKSLHDFARRIFKP
ncbi:MAG: hypothetical protein ABSG04_09980 [Verrucomicrobiota bacterium]